jgi:hypothetical protein
MMRAIVRFAARWEPVALLAAALFLIWLAAHAHAQGTAVPRTCNKVAFASPSTATTTALAPASADRQAVNGNTIFVCGLIASSAGTQTVQLEYGSDSSCSSPVTLTPAFPLVAGEPLVADPGIFAGLTAPGGSTVCVVTGEAEATAVEVFYDDNPL